jgi:hypothetical protein
VSTVVPVMRSTLARTGLLLGAAVLAAGCAAQPGSASAPASTSSSAAQDAEQPDGGELVLRVEQTGGFVPPQMTYSRLPIVSVYADGRVFTQGPVAAIYPGPALPNVLVNEVERSRVEELVQLAVDAGVGQEIDYGTPTVADAPSTLFTVVTADGPRTTEVDALGPGVLPEGDDGGLSERQTAARATLQDLLDALTAAGTGGEQPYEPEAVAAVVGEWVDTDELPAPEDVPWPGPPLPGEALGDGLGLGCVTARGEAADAVLAAAATANANTPWTDGEGNRWSVVLRPLLPDERSCADLSGP